MNICFIGTGSISRAHFAALDKIEDIVVGGCADTDQDRAAEAAARFPGAGAYGDFRRMLDEVTPEAVWVCVPPFAHGEMELELVGRGIPFFVEKPLGVDLETPQRIVDALEGTSLITSVGYLMRYRKNVARVKELLEKETPVVARATYASDLPEVYWWRQKKLSGGQIVEQSTHVYDLARYLLGEVLSVFCRGRKGLIEVEDYDVEDASIATLVFESGLIGDVISTCALKHGELSLDVFTATSRATLAAGRMNLHLEEPGMTADYTAEEDAFFLEDQAFVNAVRTGDASGILSSYGDAFKTQSVCCAANESMLSGQPVSFHP